MFLCLEQIGLNRLAMTTPAESGQLWPEGGGSLLDHRRAGSYDCQASICIPIVRRDPARIPKGGAR